MVTINETIIINKITVQEEVKTPTRIGVDGISPHIGDNGNWWIGEVDTGICAEGVDGQDGANGLNGITPHIGENENWWIGETDTGIQAIGADGQPGSDGLPGKSLTFDDLTQDQIEVLQAQLQEVYLSETESQSGKINLFGVDYDLYEKIVDIADLPKVEGAEQTYTVSTHPLGFNLYMKVEALIVPKVDKGVVGDFYNESYKVTRLFVDSDLNTKVTIKCLADISEDVKATLHLQYIKDFGDMLELNITVPETINPADVMLSFPVLKYNKKNVASVIIEDCKASYNAIFSAINKRWVDNEQLSFFIPGDSRRFCYHLNFQYAKDGITYTKSTGYYPSKAIEYTDGAGIRHRYAYTLDALWWVMGSRDQDVGMLHTYTSAKEARLMIDFGMSLICHDIKGVADAGITTYEGITQKAFNDFVDIDRNEYNSLTDRYPKAGSTASGHLVYLRHKGYPGTEFIVMAQNPPAQHFKPFAADATLDKQVIQLKGQPIIGDYGLDDFLADIVADSAALPEDRIFRYILVDYPYASDGWTAFFESLELQFGASGADSLWFPSFDELYEYWFMTKYGAAYKEVNGQNIRFKIYAPCGKNFWFRSLSCLLSGITSLDGVTVSSSANCFGTSYAINDGKLLVNLDFNTDLLAKAEKYLQIVEANPDQEYAYDDALYFIQQLKTGVREPFQARLDAALSIPVLTYVSINTGDIETTSRNVIITLVGSENWSQIMLSESATFAGAEWEAFTGISKAFVLSEGYVSKTVYVKVKNSLGESEARNDSIDYIEESPVLGLNGILINAGAETTGIQTVNVSFDYSGTPTHYMLSESVSFEGAEWVVFEENPEFVLSEGYELKTIYAKIKDAASESEVRNDSITYADSSVKAVVSLSAAIANATVSYDTGSGITINKTGPASAPIGQPGVLKDISGNSLSWHIEFNSSFYQPDSETTQTEHYTTNSASGNPALTGDTGPYPDTYISKCHLLGGSSGSGGAKKARMVMTLPVGSYRMKIIMSTSSGYALSANERLNSFYKVSVNGTPGTPVVAGPEGFTGLNNTAFNAEVEFIVSTVADGNVILYFYNIVSAGFRPGINLFEIIKLS